LAGQTLTSYRWPAGIFAKQGSVANWPSGLLCRKNRIGIYRINKLFWRILCLNL